MTAFGIGTNTHKINSGRLIGNKKSIACQCWFTSKGKSIPLMIKYEDNDGMIQTIKEIEVRYSEKKNYAGIPTIEYGCKIFFQGRTQEIKLIFNQSDCQWFMII